MKFISALILKILAVLGKQVVRDGEAEALVQALSNVGQMLVKIAFADLTPEARRDLYETEYRAFQQVVQAALATGVILVDEIPELLLELASDEVKSLLPGASLPAASLSGTSLPD